MNNKKTTAERRDNSHFLQSFIRVTFNKGFSPNSFGEKITSF